MVIPSWLTAKPQQEPKPTILPMIITMQDAIRLAEANSPQFRQAVIAYQIARQSQFQARAGLLPSLAYNTQYLYTEGNGTPSGVFIANNGVHEYSSQGDVHETLSAVQFAEYRRSLAAAALANAQQQIAIRGLVLTVVQTYSNLLVAQRRIATGQEAISSAGDFLKITQQMEQAREVAHSDEIKAQLQYQDRVIDFSKAQVRMLQAKLQLAVLVFRDFNQNFEIVDDLESRTPLLPKEEALRLARHDNPELNAALASVRVAASESSAAKAGYFPTLTVDYFYGIDASRFATKTGQINNLGYSAAATLSLPIWNWGITRSRVRQAELRGQLASTQLKYAQRKVLADFESFYYQAERASNEVATLRSSLNLANESLRLTTLRYEAGEATALEVVDAQKALALERNSLDDSEAAYLVAVAELKTITGSF